MGNVTQIKPVSTSGRGGSGGHGPVKWIFAVLGAVAVAAAAIALAGTDAGLLPVIGVSVLGLAGVLALFAPRPPFQVFGVASLVVALVGATGLLAGVLKYEEGTASGSPTLETSFATTTEAAAMTTTGPLRSGEGWYDLSLHEPLEIAQGQELVPSIVIGVGKEAFPNSIRGFLVSSPTQQVNASTWTTDSKCTRLSVWIGKDAASTLTDGAGEFVVEADGEEIASRQATSSDAPQHVEVDISTVDRLRLLDVRGSKDADNAWGNPRVYCTSPPGKARS